MMIRKATYHDAPFIKLLMEGLGYKTSNSLLVEQLTKLFDGPHHQVIVSEDKGEVNGFAVVHVLPQLAFDGGIMLISYLSVDERAREHSVARALEVTVRGLARQAGCMSIQAHCAAWRSEAKRFFLAQGYQDYPDFFKLTL